MMTVFSFKQLITYSSIVDQNDFFIQYYNSDALFRYDSNYFELLFSPTSQEFELIEEMQILFASEHGLNHIKFVWPENTGLLPDTLSYLNEQDYGLEKLALLAIDPTDFKGAPFSSSVRVLEVTADLLDTLKSINYMEDLTISKSYAQAKGPFYDSLFSESLVRFYIAFYDNEPAGSCIVAETDYIVEIDDLFTVKMFRHKGVATALQEAVMVLAQKQNKSVVLAADAEDSPVDMYINQGYEQISFRIGAQKKQ